MLFPVLTYSAVAAILALAVLGAVASVRLHSRR
jgi:hypothetical protein